MIDKFYTPESIATDIFAGLGKACSVADFAIGDGSLIKNLPFLPEHVYGLDIDDSTISSLTANHTNWSLKVGDFLNLDTKTASWLNRLRGNLDLIVLNPPFSCKGKKRIKLLINDKHYVCRVAIAFLAKSLEFLSPNGRLIAILPLSCVKSEADTKVFNELANLWNIEFGDKFGPSTFAGCSPSSTVVTFTPKPKEYKTASVINFQLPEKSVVEIVRGTVTMPATKNTGLYPVLHTVNLQLGNITPVCKYTDRKVKYVSGTYLCFPRVCKPSKEKLVIVKNQSFVLSDCLFAIRMKDRSAVTMIKQVILDNWNDFAELYESTCAPYITVAQIQSFLRLHGFSSIVCNEFKKTESQNFETSRVAVGLALSL